MIKLPPHLRDAIAELWNMPIEHKYFYVFERKLYNLMDYADLVREALVIKRLWRRIKPSNYIQRRYIKHAYRGNKS